MAKRTTRGTYRMEKPVYIHSYASVAGTKEGAGPLGSSFDAIITDSHFGESTWERAESRFQREAVQRALDRGRLRAEDIDIVCAGDLINQCTGTSYGLRELGIPFLGIYGACSTMAEGLLTAGLLIESGAAEKAIAATSSHFSTAERQFRAPLSYGGQRTPTSQWTCTAAGAAVLTGETGAIEIAGGCIGKITDMGVSDMTDMGSAMAPAAADTIQRYLEATGTRPSDYTYIVTGDLGIHGSRMLTELMSGEGIEIAEVHRDCGVMIYDPSEQDTHCGGSGCGCSASVLCGHFLPQLESGEAEDILFAATGALMSVISLQQGETIPSIAHLVHLRRKK